MGAKGRVGLGVKPTPTDETVSGGGPPPSGNTADSTLITADSTLVTADAT